MTSGDSDLLRQMVRQVLREIVPETMSPAAAATSETVHIVGDDDLAAFARRVACASAEERAAIASGATTFRLAVPAPGASADARPAAAGGAVLRIDSGAVTERHVREAAASESRIVLGRKAVMTPLARDRARAAGVEITRER